MPVTPNFFFTTVHGAIFTATPAWCQGERKERKVLKVFLADLAGFAVQMYGSKIFS